MNGLHVKKGNKNNEKDKELKKKEKQLVKEELIKEKEKELIKEKEKEKEKKKNITIWNSIRKNYLVWIVVFLCIYILSPERTLLGIASFIILFISSYFTHLFSHQNVNIFNILHHYHHYYNNYFSHYIQVSLELSIPLVFLPVYYYFDTIFLDVWVILFSVLLYCSIHNVNYGYLKVNKVHSLHHEDVFTNLGPDFFDVLFNTKNEKDVDVEDISHYIPNAIILTLILLVLQYICLNKTCQHILRNALIVSILSIGFINMVSSIYIYYYYAKALAKRRDENGCINYLGKVKNFFNRCKIYG